MPTVPASPQPNVAPGYQYSQPPVVTMVERPRKRGAGMIVAITALAVLVVGLGAAIAVIQLTKSTTTASPVAKTAPKPGSGSRAATAGSSPTVTAALPLTTTTIPAAETEAQQLSSLLANSAEDRSEIVSAVAQITSCGDLSDAQETLDQAATSRQGLLDQLGTMQLGALPNSVALVQALQSAWQASLSSDSSYAAYAGDEMSNFNGCVPNDPNDTNAQSAAQSDSQATAAKTQFVGLWNPIATTYGLPQYQQSGL